MNAPLNLTSDQQLAIQNGVAVPVTINDTECVLVRKDVFERADDFDPRPLYPSILKAWDADDENPDQYREYLRDS
jgi:hypothetical protein